MAKRMRFSEYHDRYANYRLELTDDGILFMQCHTNGGSLVWDGLDINELPEDAERLLHRAYSMILISYAVNVFKQNRIPDSGAAFFDMVAEPAP
jgi:hypothetical protein